MHIVITAHLNSGAVIVEAVGDFPIDNEHEATVTVIEAALKIVKERKVPVLAFEKNHPGKGESKSP